MVVALVALPNSIESPPTEPVGPIEPRRAVRVTVGGVDAHSVLNHAAARRLILSKVRASAASSEDVVKD